MPNDVASIFQFSADGHTYSPDTFVVTSEKKHKEDICDLDSEIFSKIRFCNYTRNDNGAKMDCGIIIDELQEISGHERCNLILEKDGNKYINYHKLWVMNCHETQKLRKELDVLKVIVANMKNDAVRPEPLESVPVDQPSQSIRARNSGFFLT